MVIIDHADELLQGLHSGGRWESANCSNLLLQGKNALMRYVVSQEIDLFGPKDAFVVSEDETGSLKAFEDQLEMAPVLFRSGGENEDVIDVGDAEGEITKDGVYHSLKGGTSITKAKAGVIEGVGADGCGDGSLGNVVWMHGDLIVSF